MNCLFLCLNKLLLHAYFYQQLVKTGLEWKVFNISQQTTTFATQTNLSTYHGKYILNWLTEVQVLFFQYAENKSSDSLLP